MFSPPLGGSNNIRVRDDFLFMRIAILASNVIRLPPSPEYIPQGYSGAPEHITSVLSESLIKRGYDVTLFASGDSQTSSRLVSVTTKSTSMDPNIGMDHHMDYENLLVSRCYEMACKNEFDLIHSMMDTRSFMFAPFTSVPTVCTLHSPLITIRKDLLSRYPNAQWYVSISNSQRIPLPHLRYAGTVYHGIDITAFSLGDGKEGYYLFVGRMVENKGIQAAIDATKEAHVSLYLLGEPIEHDTYWSDHVAPFIDDTNVKHEGFVEKEKLIAYYQQATALLFPIQWEEPFGLVMVEAMACGTPVIAYNRGSVPEIVRDGVTGFIIDPNDEPRPGKGTWTIKKQGIDGLVEAIGRIGEIDRKACRRHVEEHFTVEKMVDGYEEVYREIMNNAQ